MFLEYIMIIKAWQKKFEALIWHTNIFNWKKNWDGVAIKTKNRGLYREIRDLESQRRISKVYLKRYLRMAFLRFY